MATTTIHEFVCQETGYRLTDPLTLEQVSALDDKAMRHEAGANSVYVHRGTFLLCKQAEFKAERRPFRAWLKRERPFGKAPATNYLYMQVARDLADPNISGADWALLANPLHKLRDILKEMRDERSEPGHKHPNGGVQKRSRRLRRHYPKSWKFTPDDLLTKALTPSYKDGPKDGFVYSVWSQAGSKVGQLPEICDWFESLNLPKDTILAETCAGTAATAINLLHRKVVDRVILTDMSPGVAALLSVLCDGKQTAQLVDMVLAFEPTTDRVYFIHDYARKAKLKGLTLVQRAFVKLVTVKTSHNRQGSPAGRNTDWSKMWRANRLVRHIERTHRILNGRVIGGRCFQVDAAEVVRILNGSKKHSGPEAAALAKALPKNGKYAVFADPPYTKTALTCYRDAPPFTDADQERLAEALKACPWPFMYCNDDGQLVFDLLGDQFDIQVEEKLHHSRTDGKLRKETRIYFAGQRDMGVKAKPITPTGAETTGGVPAVPALPPTTRRQEGLPCTG